MQALMVKIFREMNDGQLGNTIQTILAMRHLFDTEVGSLCSLRPDTPAERWATVHQERLEEELRAACIEYAQRTIDSEDEALSRNLILAAALSWIPNNPFSVEVKVTLDGGSQ